MSRVEEADSRIRDVTLERLRARRQKEGIVLAPCRQERRLVGAEISLEGRVEPDVAFIVAEQVELHVGHAGPAKVKIVERIAVRRDSRRVGRTVGILPDGRLWLEEGAQRLAI